MKSMARNADDSAATAAVAMNSTQHSHPYQLGAGLMLLALAVPLLWWVSHPSRLIALAPAQFVFWHTVVELLAVVVAMLIFITGYRAILSPRKGAVVWLGIAFLGVGLLDLLHTMSYVGMPDAMTPNSPQKSIVFWLAARLLAAIAMLVYASLPSVPEVGKVRKRLALVLMACIVGALGYAGLLHPDQLPAFFIAGRGLTSLKVGAEWLVIALNLTTLLIFWVRRQTLARECLMALVFAVALSTVSELFFTMFGVEDQDSANALGHAYKVAAYLYLFHATFNEALRRPLERIEMQHLREKVTLSAAPDGVLWVDQSGHILMANPAMEALTGYSPSHLVGQSVDIFLPPHLRERHAQSMRKYFFDPGARAMGNRDLELRRSDGRLLPVDISLGYWEDDGAPHAIAYIRDLTERKKFEESLRHHATHDELTGLPNRWLFRLQLNQALARAARSGLRVAVLLLDLDDFKTVNDSFGHATGDALLVQVGHRIRGILRDNDMLARMGGDEFGILLTDLADVDEAIRVAAKLLTTLQASYRLQNQDVYSGGSMGLAFYPDDAGNGDTLLRYADMAMYQAKQAGRGAYACYSSEMDRRVHENMRLHTRLKEALAQNILRLHYQPQVKMQSDALVGVEALLRWDDPLLGSVPPSQFIPIAEATGLIIPLSDWVLETACQQIATWSQAGTPVRVAINVSAQQLQQGHLPDKVKETLARTGAQARWLDLEITESVAMTQPKQALEQLNALVALGCSVSLDDFGTGYSSLAYLKTLPVSKIKIDQSFVRDISSNPSDAIIVRTIIGMAETLGLDVIAEGVETEAQRQLLEGYGCPAYQGYLHCRPLPREAFEARLKDRYHTIVDEN
jgi:diguanylate cyclase (GGDEF)-like protein/PAS domain S-box-containing protein